MLEHLPDPSPKWLNTGERSFAYPYKEWRKPRGWCLTFFTNRHRVFGEREIIGIGSAFPGRRSGTYERTLITRDFTPLGNPLRLVELEGLMGRSRQYLRDDGRMSEAAGKQLLESVRQLRHELAEPLSDLEHGLVLDPPEGVVGERLSLEKDAVGMLLDVAGMDRDPIEAWQPPVDRESRESRSIPFLRGLPDLRIIEDQQIIHDYQRFPGMEGEDAIEVGWRIYRRDGRNDSRHQLFVYNANRTHLETVMGVDMIYVNEHSSSVATVQYKRMRQEWRGWAYRHDKSGKRELERMAEIDKECELVDTSDDPRLITSPSMIKLCRTIPFAMNSSTLIPGMYLTRTHFEDLLRSPAAQGPRGGTRIYEDEIPRYLNNTTFATLLKDGWIGTRGAGTDFLISLIRHSLSPEGAGSVVVGVHRSPVPPGNRRMP